MNDLEALAEKLVSQVHGASWKHILNAGKETRQEYDGGLSYDYWIEKARMVKDGKYTEAAIIHKHNY